MKYLNEIGDSNKNTLDKAYKQAYSNLDITEEDFIFDNPKKWRNVRQEVGKIMQDKVKGRTIPMSAPRVTPNREGLRIMREYPVRSYPFKAKNKTQKLRHLWSLLKTQQIEFKMFITFADALKIQYSKKMYQEKLLMEIL